ncbi:hypothetical protein YC2023_095454 [Brassica napus]
MKYYMIGIGLVWEAYLHPAVEGITLTDKDFNDTETAGDVIDKLLKAWTKKLQRRDVSLLHRLYDVNSLFTVHMFELGGNYLGRWVSSRWLELTYMACVPKQRCTYIAIEFLRYNLYQSKFICNYILFSTNPSKAISSNP